MISGANVGRDRTALVISIAAHLAALLVVALLLPPLIPAFDEPKTVFVPLVRLDRRIEPPVPRPLAAPAAGRTVSHALPAAAHPLPAVHQRPPRELAVPRAALPESGSVAASVAAPVAPVPADATTGTAAAAPVPTSAPVAPAPTPVVVEPARSSVAAAGVGPFGASYPPGLLPAGTERTLRAQLGTHYEVRVSVDETGRATALHWILPIAAPALRDQVTRMLLAAKYVPAECDGLACADTYDLRG